MDQQLRVGFIGLGNMGSGICANIQKAGYPATVYNQTLSKTTAFQKEGTAAAGTPCDASEASDTLLTSLMDDASILDMCTGEDGILSGVTEKCV